MQMVHIAMKTEAAVENFCTKKVKVSISEAGEGLAKLELSYMIGRHVTLFNILKAIC